MTKSFLKQEFRGNWHYFLGVVLLVVLISYATLITPFLIGRIVDVVIPEQDMELLIKFVVLMSLATLATVGLKSIKTMLTAELSNKTTAKLRSRLISKCLNAEVSSIEQIPPSTIVSRITNSAGVLVDVYLIGNTVGIISEVTFMLIVGVSLYKVHPLFFLGVSVLMPIFYLITKLLTKSFGEMVKKDILVLEKGKMKIQEIASKTKYIKQRSGQEREMKWWNEWTEEYKVVRKKLRVNRELTVVSISDTMINMMYAVIFMLGVSLMFAGQDLTMGQLMLFVTLAPRLFGSFRELLVVKISRKALAEGIDLVDEIMTLPQEVQAKMKIDEIHSISFENVSYMHDDDSGVRNLTMQLDRGDTIGIVGLSGSGKTTIYDLLFGFIKPTEGIIKVNGNSLDEIDLYSLRNCIYIADQKSTFLNLTVMENIAYPHKIEDSIDKIIEEVDFDGINKDISVLSGGEIQKVKIAAALYHNDSLLLMDEFTSALDPIAERKMMSLIESQKDKIILIISHRVYTLMNCDKVIVVDGGKIIENDSPGNLLKNRKSLFHKLLKISQVR